jgi:hypothetical protein
MMRKLLSVPLLSCVLGTTACAVTPSGDAGEANAPSAADIPVATNTVSAAPAGTLDVTVAGDRVSGKFDNAADSVTFTSSAKGNDVYEVTVNVHGMTLDATFSLADKAASFDGFSSSNGEDTQILENDREALKVFYQAIQTKGGKDANKATDMLIRTAGIWAETGSSNQLSQRVMGEEGRGWTMLCDRLGTWVDGTHDDWDYDRWEAKSSYHVLIGDYGGSTTYYWRNNAWSTQSYNHASWPYEYGNCYGRCGDSCGSGHVYSQDCLDHDGCVRNGHSQASFWCDDEFSACVDDFSFAPNCY